ncbi:hypothetical protein BKA70DRAFT_113605 [Coprinopsis sp. MPI-PUGE-AT-0042]|nr:hypothetical protein BKA70DRAFT_113605 [Coprinopsis sp. MPI-PUGE-AT-0042]
MPMKVDVSSLTLAIYDYVCTLKEEVGYMWTSQWSLGLCMFFLNRYLVFIDQTLLHYFTHIVNPSPMDL